MSHTGLYMGIESTFPHHHCGGGIVIYVGGPSGSGPSEAHENIAGTLCQ